jgi:hypothetical protein
MPVVELSSIDAVVASADEASQSWRGLIGAPAPADSQQTDGFFSGVFRKTGSTVSSSLGKASNSVVGAVRAVGDVVKRAF